VCELVVCRTDLHIVEGELAHPRANLISRHQIVGESLAAKLHSCPVESTISVKKA